MIEHDGWIKLHRKTLKWEWYSDANVFRVFMHLLLTASHLKRRYRGRDLPAGSVVTGRNALAEACGLSVQKVRTALDKLQSTGEITITTTAHYSIISILKWDDYQSNNHQVTINQPSSNHQLTINQPSVNHQVTTIQECKKVRMEESSGAGIVRFPGGHSLVSDGADGKAVVGAGANKGKQVDVCRDILVACGYDYLAFEANGGHYRAMIDLLDAGVKVRALEVAASRCGTPARIARPPEYIAKVYRANADDIEREIAVDPHKAAVGEAIAAWQKAGKVGPCPRPDDFDAMGNRVRKAVNDA
jgi:TusA-related sulfurtransferase